MVSRGAGPVTPWRVVRIALGTVLVALALRQLVHAWGQAQAQPVEWQFRPAFIVASIAVTLVMYGLLIMAWRGIVTSWGQHLGLGEAARIWMVSSLGKYIPGKVWAIAGMAVMARERGVAAWAATGAAILNQGLAVLAGAVVVGATGTSLLRGNWPWIDRLLLVLVVGGVAGLALLLSPSLVRRVLGWFRIASTGQPTPGAGSVVIAALANIVAWTGYGISLWLLARGVLAASPSLKACIAAFTASYIAGLIAVIAPAGIGVRESVFILMLQGAIGVPAAAALAIASRLMLTATEVGAAVPFLVTSRERPRVAT